MHHNAGWSQSLGVWISAGIKLRQVFKLEFPPWVVCPVPLLPGAILDQTERREGVKFNCS